MQGARSLERRNCRGQLAGLLPCIDALVEIPNRGSNRWDVSDVGAKRCAVEGGMVVAVVGADETKCRLKRLGHDGLCAFINPTLGFFAVEGGVSGVGGVTPCEEHGFFGHASINFPLLNKRLMLWGQLLVERRVVFNAFLRGVGDAGNKAEAG